MPIEMNDIGLARQTVAFVKKEDTLGTLADFVATDAVGCIELPKATQAPRFSNSKEIVESRSVLQRFKGRTPAGTWNCPIYLRPSGAAGTPPVEAAFLEAFFGLETIDPGVSVAYTPALIIPTISLGFRTGHVTTFVSGAAASDLALSYGSEGGVELRPSGGCMKVVTAGKSKTIEGSSTTVLKVTVGEEVLYVPGARVEIGDDDNSGSGYTVQSIDTTGHTITIAPAMSEAPAADAVVQGFLPTPSLSGSPLENRLAALTFDAVALVSKSGELRFRQEIKWMDDANYDGDYPPGFIPGARSVEGTLNFYFLRKYAAWYYQAKEQVQQALSLAFDGGAGSISTWALPQMEVNMPDISGELDLEASLTVSGMASAGEDEASATYT